MENDAAQLSSLETGLLLLRQVACSGCLGKNQSDPCGKGAGSTFKKKAPTAAIIDSQSVKMVSQPGERGFDAGKKIMGRKRHILVDTLGLILGVVVHPADGREKSVCFMQMDSMPRSGSGGSLGMLRRNALIGAEI
jgi:hypothetical protein